MRTFLPTLLLALLAFPATVADQRPPEAILNPFCPVPGYPDVEPGTVVCIRDFRNPQPLTLVRMDPFDTLVQAYQYTVTVPNVGAVGIACSVASVGFGEDPPQAYAPCDGIGSRGNPIGPALYVAGRLPTTTPGPIGYLVEATLEASDDDLGIQSLNIILACADPACEAPLLLA